MHSYGRTQVEVFQTSGSRILVENILSVFGSAFFKSLIPFRYSKEFEFEGESAEQMAQ